MLGVLFVEVAGLFSKVSIDTTCPGVNEKRGKIANMHGSLRMAMTLPGWQSETSRLM